MMPETGEYDNLLIVRAFTKSFAIPGVRLGYLVSSNRKLRNNIKAHLPEWNLSAFAQEAGIACAAQKEYLGKTREYIRTERKILSENLKNTGIRVFDGEADFLLIYTDIPLYGELLKRGILIRRSMLLRSMKRLPLLMFYLNVHFRGLKTVIISGAGHLPMGIHMESPAQ